MKFVKLLFWIIVGFGLFFKFVETLLVLAVLIGIYFVVR